MERSGQMQNMSADGVYIALSNSLSTMRMKYRQVFCADAYDIPTAIMCNVSSPSSAKDMIMRLVKDATKNPQMLAMHVASWQSNPDYTYDSLRQEYSHIDERTFMRDFGAEPPLAADPFLSEGSLVDKIAVDEPWRNLVIEETSGFDSMGGVFKSAISHIVMPDKNIPRMLTIDLGFRKNALALCIFSMADGAKIRLDACMALTPSKDKPINLVDFFDNVTLPIVENFSIKHVFYDRWQSMDQVQRLRDKGIDARIHSLKYAEMAAVRGAIIARSICIPKMPRPMGQSVTMYLESESFLSKESVTQLGIQLLTVRDIGTKMTKPETGDDDIFRAFCLGIDRLSDNEIRKVYLAGAKKVDNGSIVRALGTVRLMHSGDVAMNSMGTMASSDGRAMGSIRTIRKGRKS